MVIHEIAHYGFFVKNIWGLFNSAIPKFLSKNHKKGDIENSLGKFYTPNTLQKKKIKIKEKGENGA